MPRLWPWLLSPFSICTLGRQESPWSSETEVNMCCWLLSPTEKLISRVCAASGETVTQGLSSRSVPLALSVVVVTLMPADQVAPPSSEKDDSMNMSVGMYELPCW